MSDLGHKKTDETLAALERRIERVYGRAAKELEKTIEGYFAKLKDRDKHQQELLKAGKITEEQYTQWRLNQIGRGKRFEALRDKVAERYTRANETAISYVNDETPGVYALNRNYAAYTIEKVAGNVDFTLWDEQTVKRLIVEEPDLMPYYPKKKAVKRGIDLAWGKKQITASVTSGILQGKSIGKIADDLQDRIQDMNRTSAVRAARTAMTGAQNAGRYDSYKAAQRMGIKIEAKWIATLDNRTRHTHALLDGQRRKLDKPFEVDGKQILYPGHPLAVGELVYNCRCTIVAEVEGPKDPNALRRAIDPVTGKSVLIPDMTYAQWESWKKSENMYAWETYMKKGRKASSDQKQYEEYKKILGKNVPNNFAAFQDMKYNDTETWDYTKRLASYIRKHPNSSKKYFDVQEELKKAGINKGVVLPPVQKQAFILPSGGHDPNHIMKRMAERQITDDELRGYMKDAKVMFSQWGGKRQLFYSESGSCVIWKQGENWIFKTAWKKDDYDEEFDKIGEATENVRL